MDINNLIQYTIYSKLLNEIHTIPISIVLIGGFCIIVLNMIPYSIYKSFEIQITGWFENRIESSLILPFHTKNYTMGMHKVSTTFYSERFLAVNHFLQTHKTDIFSLMEQQNFESTRDIYSSFRSEFIMLPGQNQRILICKKQTIYLEMIIETIEEEESTKNKPKVLKNGCRQYTYKLSKRGLDNIGELNKFVDDCLLIYHKEQRDKDDIQKIFEYQLSKTDDDGIQTLSFQESIFQSNKTFANIFFENKQEVLKDIQKFSRNLSEKEKNEIKAEYKYQGTPFKSIYLLYGPPGVGKSSLIKAFMNETKRHGMAIPWSRIKTAADFTNICRVNHKNLSQKDVILIFEDFDANSSTVVKTRKNLKLNEKEKQKTEENNEGSETVIKNTLDTLMKISILPDKEKDDELTLECVLNTLDGINELHDAVIVFTTNDIISIDPALLRSGRIDKIIHMDYIKTPIIKEMIEYSFKTKVKEVIPDMQISPAIVQEICKMCKPDIHKCIAELIQQGCPLNNITT